jgi:hypothetical protein
MLSIYVWDIHPFIEKDELDRRHAHGSSERRKLVQVTSTSDKLSFATIKQFRGTESSSRKWQ